MEHNEKCHLCLDSISLNFTETLSNENRYLINNKILDYLSINVSLFFVEESSYFFWTIKFYYRFNAKTISFLWFVKTATIIYINFINLHKKWDIIKLSLQ